jgi:recombinational DNA repair protein (RecF pathway)
MRSVLAKGIRTSRKRFAGVGGLFSTIDMQISERSSGVLLLSAALVRSRDAVAASWPAYQRACSVVKMVRSVAMGCVCPDVLYRSVEYALDCLEAHRVHEAAAVYPVLLGVAGVMPDSNVCVRCGQVSHEMAALASGKGGFVCPGCVQSSSALVRDVAQAMLQRPLVWSQEIADGLEACAWAWFAAHFNER